MNRSFKFVLTSIAQAVDCGLQADPELSPFTRDARTLLPKVGAARFVIPVNLSELSKRH